MSETSVLEKAPVSTNGKKAEKPVIDLGYRFKGAMEVQKFIDTGIPELQAAIPFNIEPKKIECAETIEIAGIKLSKLKSIPLSLTIIVDKATAIGVAAQEDISDEDDRLAFDRGLLIGLVCLMLLYYSGAEWTVFKAFETLSEHQVNELWRFFGKQRYPSMKEDDSDSGDSEGKP